MAPTPAVPNRLCPRARRQKADRRTGKRPGHGRAFAAALLAAALVTAFVTSACGAADRPLLEQFFSASRLRDLTALQSIATTAFEPARDGIVRAFRVVSTDAGSQATGSPERHVTLDADVILPDGTEVKKTLVVTLQLARAGGRNDATAWRVTAVR